MKGKGKTQDEKEMPEGVNGGEERREGGIVDKFSDGKI